jgi:hypothetical protein
MREIITEVDGGEFTDIQLVERIIRLKHEKADRTDALKRTQEELAQRLIDRGVTEIEVTLPDDGECVVSVAPKMLADYDQNTLASLKNCTTEDQVWLAFKQVPSGKQLKALSELAGAAAKAVIESAKRKNETDVQVIKIKKPRKKRW